MFRENHKLEIYYWEDIFKKCDLPYRVYSTYRVKADSLGMPIEDYLGKLIYLTY
jgi:hypothetical protein